MHLEYLFRLVHEARPKRFVNRELELKEMERCLSENETRESHNQAWNIILTAQEMGTGKTALARAFADSCAAKGKPLSYIYVSWERISAIETVSSVTELKRLACLAVASAIWTQFYDCNPSEVKKLQSLLAKSAADLNLLVSSTVSERILLHFDESDLLWRDIEGKPAFYHLADYLCAQLGAARPVLCYFSGRSTKLWQVGRQVNHEMLMDKRGALLTVAFSPPDAVCREALYSNRYCVRASHPFVFESNAHWRAPRNEWASCDSCLGVGAASRDWGRCTSCYVRN